MKAVNDNSGRFDRRPHIEKDNIMTTDQEKEPEATATGTAQAKLDESPEQAQQAKPDTAPKGDAESKAQAGSTTEITATAPEKDGETPKKVEATATATAAGKVEDPPAPADTQPSDTVDQGGKTTPQEPAGIDLSLISDSTSILEINMFVTEDDGKLLGDPDLHTEMQIFIAGGAPDYAKKTEAEKLEYGKDLCGRYYWQMNKATLRTGAVMVEYAIDAGTGFRIIKDLAKESNQSWEDWYVNNMPGKTLRTVEKYMLLSRRTDAHQYKHLGLEKLLHLISATKTYEVEDKIGAFLTRFNIVFDEESQETVQEFECKVEAGIMVTRLSKEGVSVPFELMERFAKSRLNLNKRMIEELKLIKDNSEKVDEYIQKVITGQGKLPAPMDETEISNFNQMVARMIKSIGEMADKAALARQLSLQTINELEEKIAALKRLIPAN